MSKPSSDSPDRREYAYSLFKLLAATALLVWFTGWAVYLLIAAVFSGHIVFMAAGVGALVGLPLVLAFWGPILHGWRHSGPVVTLDTEGITDVRKKSDFIPWSDIARMDHGVGETAGFLCIHFRQTDRDREDAPRLFGLGYLLKRARSLGDWNVSLRLLSCRRREVLEAAERLRRKSVRRQVVELNKGNRNGWSGSL